MSRIRSVFFDVGGTLLRAEPSVGHVYADVLIRFGRILEPERLQAAFVRSWRRGASGHRPGADRFSAAEGGELGFWREFLAGVLESLGQEPLTAAELSAVYEEFVRPERYRVFDEVRPVLETLSREGIPLGIISNWDSRLPVVLERLGLAGYFQVQVVSGREGVEKPAPEIFERACSRMGVEPDEALHVGDDRVDDLEGARGAGLAALLLDRDRRSTADDRIPDLARVVEHVGQMV